MRVAVIAITCHGLIVARKVHENLNCDLYAPEQIMAEGHSGIIGYKTSTKGLVERIWGKYDSFIFIMAMGIVNRIISDYMQEKYTDPAVVVVDEMGRYAISALSGHQGGANKLAEKVALICQGDFVITTGSEATRTLIVGMGCRRGTTVDYLEEVLREGLRRIDRELKDVRLIASVEDKRGEKGFFQLSERLNIPLKFIPKTLINTVDGNFSKSELVKNILGIYSVAEPCAVLGGFRCQLLLPKTKMKGATIAIAEERFL
jgi:cobalt-precorrin 5A hydrolase